MLLNHVNEGAHTVAEDLVGARPNKHWQHHHLLLRLAGIGASLRLLSSCFGLYFTVNDHGVFRGTIFFSGLCSIRLDELPEISLVGLSF